MPRISNMRVMRLLAVVGCLLLAACIDGREEFWIHADGSGRAKVRYEFPEAAALLHGGTAGIRKIIGKFLEANDAIFAEVQHEVLSANGRIVIEIDAKFDFAPDLENLDVSNTKIPPPVRHFIGEFEVAQDGRNIAFTRTVSPGKGLPGSSFMPASSFKNQRLVYIVNLPATAKNSNATRTENGGTTLIWDHPLTAGLRQPLVARFEVTAPVPRRWIAAASAAGLLVAALAFAAIRGILGNRRARR